MATARVIQCDENVQVGKAITGPRERPSVTCFMMMTSIREDNRGTVGGK